MARGILSAHTTARTSAGATVTTVAANATDKHVFDNTDEKGILMIRNAHSGSHIVTIKRPVTVDGVALGDLQITVAAGATALVGPFPAGLYNQEDEDNELTSAVLVDPPATPTALSFALIKLGGL